MATTPQQGAASRRLMLTVGALGVVYGDIGTSPLYALRECFTGEHGLPPTPANVCGVLSLMTWSLLLVVSLRYLVCVLRADNRGEGGILALLALAAVDPLRPSRSGRLLLVCGVFGAALLYGDGVITPCVTVLGAVEGLELASPWFHDWILPASVLVLVLLFLGQRHGTSRVGSVFGPVMLLWFATLAVLGVAGILRAPQVLQGLLPGPGLRLLAGGGATGFLVLGAVFLCVTGAEALYADLGHFGRGPIQRAWFGVVFPALLLNYFGQGALLIAAPASVANPFYLLAPASLVLPLVLLATAASVIASQALISGAFSLTMQAIQLGYLPRLEIRHTSSHEPGQVYLPYVNAVLLCACIALCLGFGSSSSLAAAYGIAVTLTMITTTVLYGFAARRHWHWSLWWVLPLCALFLAVETAFFAANAPKIPHGGWFPLLVAAGLYLLMTTWKRGRSVLAGRLQVRQLPLDSFLQGLRSGPPPRVPGTAVYMAGNPQGTPLALLHNLKHNKVLHERVVLLTILTADTPHVVDEDRVALESMGEGFSRVRARFGFMEQPRIDEVLKAAPVVAAGLLPPDCTFFLSRETVLPAANRQLPKWRARLFGFLSRNAQPATAYFGLPMDRVVELGMQVEV